MNGRGRWATRRRGFALVLTLGLVALLVLLVLALAGLGRVDAQMATTAAYQTQARQNALLGLGVALGRLQELAGPDARVTGMAGITGISVGAANTTRHWCGVWLENGGFAGWLVSGANGPNAELDTGAVPIEVLGTKAVGAASANSEHVIAGKVAIGTVNFADGGTAPTVTGNYAYAVQDEGVKISAINPGPLPVVAPSLYAGTSAQIKLHDALAANAAAVDRAFGYAQLALIPLPGAPLTASVLQDNLHHVALANRFVRAGIPTAGIINVNTNSVAVWRGLFQTFNSIPGISGPLADSTISARGTTAQNGVALFATTGKASNGPFTSTSAVATYLASLFLNGTPTGSEIAAALAPMLTVRSDTFRIRAFGEAINPADAATSEARVFCEAIVQRTEDELSGPFGRRFVVTYFRWLGPDDI